MMSEPERFTSRESMQNYAEEKGRQFRWLLHKWKTAPTPEKKEKAKAKLDTWLDKHPSFKKALAMSFADKLKEC